MKTKTSLLSLAFALLTVASTVPVEAATLNINPSDTGWWSPQRAHDSTNQNYFVGFISGEDLEESSTFRDYFTFDLTGVTDIVTSATLQLFTFDVSNESELTLALYDVLTTAAALDTTSEPNLTIFDDLGSGTSYGNFSELTGKENTIIRITLNSDALIAINAARGSSFSIGGAGLTNDGFTRYIFGDSTTSTDNALILTTAVPEPSTVLGLFGLGILGGVASIRHRRSMKNHA